MFCERPANPILARVKEPIEILALMEEALNDLESADARLGIMLVPME